MGLSRERSRLTASERPQQRVSLTHSTEPPHVIHQYGSDSESPRGFTYALSPITAMHVLMVTVPGRWLDSHDRAWVSGVKRLIWLLEGQYIDASVALNLFDEERARGAARLGSEDSSQDDVQGELQHELRQREEEIGSDRFWRECVTVQQEALRVVLERRWEGGEWPDEFERRKVFLHAHSFVFSLDCFRRTLQVLADTPGTPQAVATVAAGLREALPHLKGVRDSAAHLEDRGRGLGKRGQPLDFKPVHNSLFKLPAGVLGLSNLNGSKLGYTTETGEYGEIDVSVATLSLVRDAFQEIINVFPWRGSARTIPRTA